MVYVVRTVPATAAVKAPTIIDRTNTQPPAARSPVSLGVGNFFAGVFGNFVPAGEVGGSETSPALDGGLPYR